jgi:hypothetical protein
MLTHTHFCVYKRTHDSVPFHSVLPFSTLFLRTFAFTHAHTASRGKDDKESSNSRISSLYSLLLTKDQHIKYTHYHRYKDDKESSSNNHIRFHLHLHNTARKAGEGRASSSSATTASGSGGNSDPLHERLLPESGDDGEDGGRCDVTINDVNSSSSVGELYDGRTYSGIVGHELSLLLPMIQPGRIDASRVCDQVLSETTGRVSVYACGPAAMSQSFFDAAMKRKDRMTVHVETFVL